METEENKRTTENIREKGRTKYFIPKLIFVALFIIASISPFVLMPKYGNQDPESDEANVTLPPLITEGKINWNFFLDENGKFNGKFAEDAGDYFSKKFAFRREMVDMSDRIKADVFKTSGQESVVLGEKGYLFYHDSLGDFLGRGELTDYEISSMAYDIKLMNERLSSEGIDFLFTIAPNKNSLYPELMPAKYSPVRDARNQERLVPLLEDEGVPYADLYRLFRNMDDVMYLKGDSHWNNKGAAIVSERLMTALGRSHVDHQSMKTKVRDDFKGDLYDMLYPAANVTDDQVYYDKYESNVYNKRVKFTALDMTSGKLYSDPKEYPDWTKSPDITTEHRGKRKGSLFMIRDSFGNSLTPFMADEFKSAAFVNGNPYELGRAIDGGMDTVIFEIVERNLDRIIFDAPVLAASGDADKEVRKYLASGRFAKKHLEKGYTGSLSVETDDYTGMLHLTGKLDPARTKDDAKLYVRFRSADKGDTLVFQTYRTRRDGEALIDTDPDRAYGTAAYINQADVPNGKYKLDLIIRSGSKWHRTATLGTYEQKQ